MVAVIEPLQDQHAHAMNQLDSTNIEIKRQKRALVELRQDVDIFLAQHLSAEQREHELDDELSAATQRIREEEDKVEKLRTDESQLEQKIHGLGAIREQLSRDAARVSAEWREAKESIKIKQLVLIDLKEKSHELVTFLYFSLFFVHFVLCLHFAFCMILMWCHALFFFPLLFGIDNSFG